MGVFSITQQGNNFTGLSVQFSWLVFNFLYLEFATGVVWVEAVDTASDGLASGFNLNQTISLSKQFSNHYTISLGFNHVSNAHILESETNQDAIFLGLKYIF
jgi:lipid A 3-O-deacylase PagL